MLKLDAQAAALGDATTAGDIPVEQVYPEYTLHDVKPLSPVSAFDRKAFETCDESFNLQDVSVVVGMSETYIRKVVGHNKKEISTAELLQLLDQDSFAETFVPRSKILGYLLSKLHEPQYPELNVVNEAFFEGSALNLLKRLPLQSIQCLVTSTPYWAMRLYEDMKAVQWADGEICPFGMEQTPEGFIRHSIEILVSAAPSLKMDGSVWWNLMDTFNTRTQIRSNAAEALRAMQGHDKTSWNDYECRRYSAGHAYLKDGEQCTIPYRIAERASRVGYYVKSIISWAKTGSLPEPQKSRVSRSVEYIIHLTKDRTPYFDKDAYLSKPPKLGGRNNKLESAKLSDFWYLPTSSGRDGHGAQFPLALPARCIALSSRPGDMVLDPFLGSGTTAAAAKLLGRDSVGFDISDEYLQIARKKVGAVPREVQLSIVEEMELPYEDE